MNENLENLKKWKSTASGIVAAITGVLVVWKPEIFAGEEFPALVQWALGGILTVGGFILGLKTKV